jgi:hypothetical protein
MSLGCHQPGLRRTPCSSRLAWEVPHTLSNSLLYETVILRDSSTSTLIITWCFIVGLYCNFNKYLSLTWTSNQNVTGTPNCRDRCCLTFILYDWTNYTCTSIIQRGTSFSIERAVSVRARSKFPLVIARWTQAPKVHWEVGEGRTTVIEVIHRRYSQPGHTQ